MPSISSILSANIEGIIDDYTTHAGVLSKIAPTLREQLEADGRIVSFDRGTVQDKTLVAIDGGRLKEDMAGGDLIVIGATAGEGHSSKTAYSEETIPAEAFAAVLPHRVANEKLAGGIMSALELRMLELAKADIQIIDGAYVNNVSQVLFTLIDNDDETIDNFFKAINFDEDGLLRQSMTKVMYPPRDGSRVLIALPKSDTARVYAHDYINDEFAQTLISDRVLASRLLLPGEMLLPRNIASNNALISRLEKRNFRRYEGPHQELYESMFTMMLEYFRRMNTPEEVEEGILWATYFKPYVGTPQSKAMKIEFPFYPLSGNDSGVVDHARELVGMVDADMIDGFVIEPWCQYMADVRAKDVSAAKDIIKNYLISTIEDSYDLAGLLRNYRT